jgi:glycosyltransferase involved in cell wall biosynthesis
MPTATRITHVIVRLATGGAEKSLYRLLRHTQQNFHHEVICIGTPTPIGKDIEALGVTVHWLNEKRSGPLVLNEAARLLRDNPPHILQGWMYYGNVLASLLGRRLPDTRVAWNIRHAPTHMPDEKLRIRGAMQLARAACLAPDLVIYTSHAGQESHEALGYNQYPHRVIPNGIDLTEFAPNPRIREQVRRRYGIGAEPWVSMVCRYHPLKGVNEYLAATRRLLDAGCEARFALAGTGMEPGNAELVALMQRHQLDERSICLLGEIARPQDFLPGLDLLVQASWREGTPNILLEAMACGVATVATDVGDSAYILQDQARLVPPGDPAAMAAAMERALAEKGRAQRLAAERAHLQARYEIEVCMQAYRNSYGQLVGSGA